MQVVEETGESGVEWLRAVLPVVACAASGNCLADNGACVVPAGAILQFVRDTTTRVEGVGDVCSLAVFDFDRHGNRKYGARSHANKRMRSKQVGRVALSLGPTSTLAAGYLSSRCKLAIEVQHVCCVELSGTWSLDITVMGHSVHGSPKRWHHWQIMSLPDVQTHCL
jgi:hypothetical protein